MNFFKILIILVFGFFTFSISYADNHGEVVEKVKEVIKDLENNVDDEEVPLNDPFAGNEASSSVNMNIPEDEAQDEMSLYNFKLAGLISGKDHSYISLVNSSGEFINLTLGQFLGKIKLVDLRITEAIFEKNDKSYIIIDFNNQIREANEY
ncbi:pilus assembly protein PilP [Candidatus Pelagibacter sp.]|jgi:hypothetical protein|nr:pilus assembly protein PilP [Candidatus Pelagibacter sp.]MDA9641962.1 pilus assembly protein PilP [bacterium]MDA9880567.1 pilus assembly protein PilP [Candidatus Pelagibacter sp.]MDA9890189.1 pilus assembly protein PilP [Candidatus Pelagibacter sp.]|tara:strand:+ start:581 stop:1033 length:453 start_codon:yes stop_codon:yes gene_type:complete